MKILKDARVLAMGVFFAGTFLVGCEQPVSSVIAGEDVALAYSKTGDQIMGGERPRDTKNIMARLNLTAEQRAQIEILHRQKIECEKAAMQALRISEKTIRDGFKAQRDVIKDAIKAGTITREQARTQMRALEIQEREALKNNPARTIYEAAKKACTDTFNAGVRALLTEEQQAIWDAFIANRPVNGDPRGKGKGRDDVKEDQGERRGGRNKR